MKQEYITAIVKMMEETSDLGLLNLVFQIMRKSVAA